MGALPTYFQRDLFLLMFSNLFLLDYSFMPHTVAGEVFIVLRIFRFVVQNRLGRRTNGSMKSAIAMQLDYGMILSNVHRDHSKHFQGVCKKRVHLFEQILKFRREWERQNALVMHLGYYFGVCQHV